MAHLQDVVGLLYRADWTRLSLSADVRIEKDGDLALRRARDVTYRGRRGYHLGVTRTHGFLDDLRGGR